MILRRLAYCLFFLATLANANPPAQLERDSYLDWLNSIQSNVSPFIEASFDWFYAERGRELPSEVYSDPQEIFVTVDRALSETIELEDVGEIPKAVTYGAEAYLRINAPIKTVLETILFRWGKPIGAIEGSTSPFDSIYGQRRETLEARWGQGSYWSIELKAHGGVAKDVRDNYTLLVRGNETSGYEIIGSFHSPFGETTTTSSLMMIQLRPMNAGVTAYKSLLRHMGQYYGFLGIEYGRKNFGFNVSRVRDGQVDFLHAVDELKRTGAIRERPASALNPAVFH